VAEVLQKTEKYKEDENLAGAFITTRGHEIK